jgi:hypothetical protein
MACLVFSIVIYVEKDEQSMMFDCLFSTAFGLISNLVKIMGVGDEFVSFGCIARTCKFWWVPQIQGLGRVGYRI